MPIRVNGFFRELGKIWERRAIDIRLEKLPDIGEADHRHEFRVRYSDLDINQHINWVSYVDWLLETGPVEVRDNHLLKEMEINFLAEARYGDHLISQVRLEDGKDLSCGEASA